MGRGRNRLGGNGSGNNGAHQILSSPFWKLPNPLLSWTQNSKSGCVWPRRTIGSPRDYQEVNTVCRIYGIPFWDSVLNPTVDTGSTFLKIENISCFAATRLKKKFNIPLLFILVSQYLWYTWITEIIDNKSVDSRGHLYKCFILSSHLPLSPPLPLYVWHLLLGAAAFCLFHYLLGAAALTQQARDRIELITPLITSGGSVFPFSTL